MIVWRASTKKSFCETLIDHPKEWSEPSRIRIDSEEEYGTSNHRANNSLRKMYCVVLIDFVLVIPTALSPWGKLERVAASHVLVLLTALLSEVVWKLK